MRALRILVVAVPLTWIAFQGQATGAFHPIKEPVDAAIIALDPMRDVLRLDSNHNGFYADFPHKLHQVEFQKVYGLTEDETCIKCHHLILPGDHNTSCRRCHRDLELDTNIFQMADHVDRFETAADREKFEKVDLLHDRRGTFTACSECHQQGKDKAKDEDAVMEGLEDYAKKGLSPIAPGYEYAMHGSCLTCHRLREKQLKEDPANPKSRSNCLFCHRQWADKGMFDDQDRSKWVNPVLESEPAAPPPIEPVAP